MPWLDMVEAKLVFGNPSCEPDNFLGTRGQPHLSVAFTRHHFPHFFDDSLPDLDVVEAYKLVEDNHRIMVLAERQHQMFGTNDVAVHLAGKKACE